MIYLIYLIILLAVFCYRYIPASGRNMSRKLDAQGRTYYLRMQPLGKSKQSYQIQLGLPLEEKIYFSIGPEGKIARLLKAMGVATEYQTGDSTFDKKFLFTSDDPALFEDIMRKPEMRTAIEILRKSHATFRLRAFGTRIWIEVRNVKASWLDKNQETVLAQLWETAQIVTQHTRMSAQETRVPSFAQRTIIFMFLHLAFLICGIAGFIAHGIGSVEIISMKNFLFAALALVPLAIGLWISFMTLWLGRSMWKIIALADFILIGIAGLVFLMPIAAIEANRRLPQPPPTVYSQTLAQKTCTLHCKRKQGKSSTTRDYPLSATDCQPQRRAQKRAQLVQQDRICQSSANFKFNLTFNPWMPGMTTPYRLQASQPQFDGGERGTVFYFPLNPGALGHAWIDTDTISPVPPAENPL
ncbi:MAG: hypothetical protein RBS08_02130 [Bdellovibrionales bacterium]|jgi:hypothetical protein|nr:hypothetical protein [Bdellovibrionales bacterium]